MAALFGPWSDDATTGAAGAAAGAVAVAAGDLSGRCLTKRERASRAFSRPFSARILTPRQAARSFAFSVQYSVFSIQYSVSMSKNAIQCSVHFKTKLRV